MYNLLFQSVGLSALFFVGLTSCRQHKTHMKPSNGNIPPLSMIALKHLSKSDLFWVGHQKRISIDPNIQDAARKKYNINRAGGLEQSWSVCLRNSPLLNKHVFLNCNSHHLI